MLETKRFTTSYFWDLSNCWSLIHRLLTELVLLAVVLELRTNNAVIIKQDDEKGQHLLYHVGDKIELRCDAKTAGFEPDHPLKVVWVLELRRLSDSGCGPRDPTVTLVELRHVTSDLEDDQIYQNVPVDSGWTVHAKGALLNRYQTNIETAWIGITIDSAAVENSGLYRCDARLGGVKASITMLSKSRFTKVTVISYPSLQPTYLHVPLEESLSALDYAPSMIGPEENHRQVGDLIDVTCCPNLLHGAPSQPFSVSVIYMTYVPFYSKTNKFMLVAEYRPKSGSLFHEAPKGRDWDFDSFGKSAATHEGKDSHIVKLRIRIRNATIFDTGIFQCMVIAKDEGNIFHGEVGLKVSKEKRLQAGYCDPIASKKARRWLHTKNENNSDIVVLKDEPESNGTEVYNRGLFDRPLCKVALYMGRAALVHFVIIITFKCYSIRKHKEAPDEDETEMPSKTKSHVLLSSSSSESTTSTVTTSQSTELSSFSGTDLDAFTYTFDRLQTGK